MDIVCINNINSSDDPYNICDGLTLYKIYTDIKYKEDDLFHVIINDLGEKKILQKIRFQTVSEYRNSQINKCLF